MEQFRTQTIQKDLQITQQDDQEIFNIIISSGNVDSVGDVMDIDGVDLSRFDILKGVYYNHDTSKPPIAQCLGIEKIGGYLVAKTVFHELTEESKEIKALVKAGVIKAASIQFVPIDWHSEPMQDDERKDAGLPNWITTKTIFDTWVLLEYSIVNIPANIDAQIQLRKSLINSQQEETMPIEKAGATLSKSNKDKLSQAMNLINEVVGATEEAPEEKSADISELKQMINDQAVLIDEMAEKIKELTTEKQMPEQEIEVDEEQKETETKSVTLQDYLARN